MEKITPLGSKLLIKLEEKDSQTDSGIYLSLDRDPKPEKADVVKIGDKVQDVKVGQTVYFPVYAPDEVKLDGERYAFLDESHVIATHG